jgi:hypothetical protein
MAAWLLLQISHTEALASVADRPNAYRFRRTSFCVAPESWRRLDAAELARRVHVLLDAAYAKRNHTLIGSDDPTPMVLLGYDFAWVAADELAGRPWRGAFHAFDIEEGGERWHITPRQQIDALFAERLLGGGPASR